MGNNPTSADPHKTQPGEVTNPTLGSYRLLNLLGEGGMGRVYLAQHLVSGTVVALKVIRPELSVNRSTVRRFIAEARTVSRIGHPNIVRVLDVAEPSSGEGPLYYAMEYLTGIDLRRELQSGFMLLPRAVDIGLQICEALQAVHDAGVIHRDLKPANIFLIGQEAGHDLVKVLDFGLAKLESSETAVNTTSGHLLGTPAYMSPEQAAGDSVSRQSDIYSLGVILFEMFTGRRPFEASSFGAYVVQHMTTAPIPPTAFSPPGIPLPSEVDRIVLRCLEKRPHRRYASAAELGDHLRQLLPRRTVRPTRSIRLGRPKFGRAPSRTVKTVALSTAGGLVAVAVYVLMGSSPTPPPATAPAPVISPATASNPAPQLTSSAPAADLGPSSSMKSTLETSAKVASPGVDISKARRHAGGKRQLDKAASPSPSTDKTRAGQRQPVGARDKPSTKKEENLDHVTMDPF